MARIIYAHIIPTVYAGIKVGREDVFFQSTLRGSGTFFGHLLLSVSLLSSFSILHNGSRFLLKNVKNATGGFYCFNVAGVTAASEAQDIKIVWK